MIPSSNNFDPRCRNNLLSGGGRFWSRNVVETASFNQFNRNPAWSYDADGNLLSRNESFGSSLPSSNRHDAAGRRTSVTQTRPCWLEPQHLLQLRVHTNTQTRDGDGQVTRNEQALKVGLNGTPTAVKVYYLRSSVLGGQVISEYDGSDTTPTWTNTYVYAGSERIGRLSMQGASTPLTVWRAADPVTGDEGNTYLDPNGVDVGLEDPFPPPGEEDDTCVTYDPNYIDSHPRPFLNPFEGGANCVIDGIEQACNSVGSEAAVQCRDNNCGPRARRWTNADGETFSFLTNPFMAFSNGVSGQFMPDWAEFGTPQAQADDRYLGFFGGYSSNNDSKPGQRRGRSFNNFLPPQNYRTPLSKQVVGILENDVNALLKNKDCARFVNAVLKGLGSALNATELFNAVKNQPLDARGNGGFGRRLNSTHLAQASGAIAYRNPQIDINYNIDPALANVPVFSTYRGLTVLHEMFHLAGDGAGHWEMLVAGYAVAAEMRLNLRGKPPSSDRTRGTTDPNYPDGMDFDYYLGQVCK